MIGHSVRALIAAALLLTWALPMARLAVLPQQRADALAEDAICRARWGTPAVAPLRLALSGEVSRPATAVDSRVRDVAALFEPSQTRQWRTELAHVIGVLLAAAMLLVGWRVGPLVVVAAAILYLAVHGVQWDAYRLLDVSGPRLWWLAVSHWSTALWFERVMAPLLVWVPLIAGAAALTRALWRRGLPKLASTWPRLTGRRPRMA